MDDRTISVVQALRKLLFRLVALATAVGFLLLIVVGSAGWYTSRSEFCRSCHIMDPYYDSWAASTHNRVDCIECHFAPGFGGKIRGKMLGLVQLAKYVTRTAPPGFAANVPDASCLRSGCHETRVASGRVDFHGIPFDHRPHLQTLRGDIQLRCTSCHSQIVQGPHMAVTPSTCYLCHFKNQPFNAGLSACTRCHAIPEREFDLGGGVKFTHDLAYRQGVDCVNCHRDVIRDSGVVAPQVCTSCHNRPGDVQRIGQVAFLHAKHVGENGIDCLRCHMPVEHSFDAQKIDHAAANCAGCHPNQHRDQIEMFTGTRAATGAGRAGSMLVARLDCFTCHRTPKRSPSGATVLEGSLQVCAMCHSEASVKELRAYHEQLRKALPDLQAAVDRALKALPAAKLADDRRDALRKRLDRLARELGFVRGGNDIHNIHYAVQVIREVFVDINSVCAELHVAGPGVALPRAPAAATIPPNT